MSFVFGAPNNGVGVGYKVLASWPYRMDERHRFMSFAAAEVAGVDQSCSVGKSCETVRLCVESFDFNNLIIRLYQHPENALD